LIFSIVIFLDVLPTFFRLNSILVTIVMHSLHLLDTWTMDMQMRLSSRNNACYSRDNLCSVEFCVQIAL
jgi:hypothetical protein